MKKQEIFGQFNDTILIEGGFAKMCDWCKGHGNVGTGHEPWTGDTVVCYECDGKGHKLLRDRDIEHLAVEMLEEIFELGERIAELTEDK